MKPWILLSFLLPFGLLSQQVTLPAGFVQDLIADQLNPVAMTLDHHGRIWLAEKDGKVRIVNEAGQLLPTPFIDLAVDDYNERGLLGIALHPDFDEQPYVYLYYTIPGESRNRLSRLYANGDLALPGTEDILMEFDSLQSYIHNGGALRFGADNMLYISTGDGSDANKASDLNSFHGKILRIHASGIIPGDNPFFNTLQGNYRAIYATGFRNPFSMTYDTSTDQLWIGDVGGGDFEEINLVESGKNYGWPLVEGPKSTQITGPDYADPLFAYNHNDGCAITSLVRIPDSFSSIPSQFHGGLLWGDYCGGYFQLLDTTGSVGPFAFGLSRPIGLLLDEENGWIYYLSRAGIGGGSPLDNTATDQGSLWKIRYAGDGPPHISRQPASILVSAGEAADFSIEVQGTSPIHYQWYVNGLLYPGDTLAQFRLDSTTLSMDGRKISCVVRNAFKTVYSQNAILSVTDNRRPLPEILSPDSLFLFRAGDTIRFSGMAMDPETGPMPDSALVWWVDLHHDLHTHPAAGPFLTVSSGYWVVPTIYETDPDIWYRLYLGAEDSLGLTGLAWLDIYPQLTMIFLDGPEGIRVNLDGRTLPLPAQQIGMIGLERAILAPVLQIAGDSLFQFLSWEDGSKDLLRRITTPENGFTVALQYHAIPLGQGTGLTGQYFNSPASDFLSDPVFTRLDTAVNFFWGNDSPGSGVSNDYFTARWTGDIETIFGEEYTFTVRSDDGVRLWVNDELLIDQWIPQAPTETSGSIMLTGKRRYAIVLEYMEIEGGAEINLFWESNSLAKEIIPKRQLYPFAEVITGTLTAAVWLDANRNGKRDEAEEPLTGQLVHLRQAETGAYLSSEPTDQVGEARFTNLEPGKYQLQADLSLDGGLLSAGTMLSFDGRTDTLKVSAGDTVAVSMGLYPADESIWKAFPLLKVYPNPVEDSFSLEYSQWLDQTVEIELRDILGRIIWKLEGETGAGYHRRIIRSDKLAGGVYLLRLIQGNESSHLWIIR